MSQKQGIGVTAFILYDEEVLIVKRAETKLINPGYWELPGGQVEFGETPEQALHRGIKEETGLEIKVIKPYSAFSDVADDGTLHLIDIQYICVLINDDPELILGSEHSEFKWLEENGLAGLKTSRQMKTAIEKGFTALS